VKFHADVKPEHVICDGCKADGRKYVTCIACADFACADVKFVLDNAPEAKDNLGKLKSNIM
jgi:hypothetical protein